MITGVCLNNWLFLINAQVWIAIQTRHHDVHEDDLRPLVGDLGQRFSKPSTAVTTSHPSFRSKVSAVRRMVFESSMTMTFHQPAHPSFVSST
jgi:hypothetical protein